MIFGRFVDVLSYPLKHFFSPVNLRVQFMLSKLTWLVLLSGSNSYM